MAQQKIDTRRLTKLLKDTTPGPWNWTAEDYSVVTLQGPEEETQHVVSSSLCSSCRNTVKNLPEDRQQWEWGRCTTPSLPNAELLALAPSLAKEVLRLRKKLREVS